MEYATQDLERKSKTLKTVINIELSTNITC